MPNQEKRPCPVCKLDDQDVRLSDHRERLSLICPRCGKFTITRTASGMVEKKELDHRLSAWIRDRSESNVPVPEIDSNTLNELEGILPNYRVSEKQIILLRAFERRTLYPGQPIEIIARCDYPLAWAAGEEEFGYLLRSLMERRLIRKTDGPSDLSASFESNFEITPEGWTFLDDHARPSAISDQVFVAMSFSQELKCAWNNGIKPALESIGFRPYRVDAAPHLDKIDAKIITEIKNSRFLIADVTEQRLIAVIVK